MGKLGKKARKFAKKQLQSVLRQRRKTKALFKRKAPKGRKNVVDKQVGNSAGRSNGRITKFEDTANISLDVVFTKNENEFEDLLDSDGYLSEDLPCPYAVGSETEKIFEDEIITSSYSDQNKKIEADLALQVKKLDRLRKKDPGFSKFLENYNNGADKFQNADEYSDVEDSKDQDDDSHAEGKKLLTNSVINTWCQMVRKDNSQPALISLLNAYRAACHYGAESSGRRIENSETFCSIIVFTLSNADDIFRGQLEISSSNSTREMLSELKKNPKWKALKPLVKSYARSTLFLLNHVTDSDLLAFVVTRLRASIIFFAAFPSLMQRLIKTTVHLWATGGRTLSSTSYILIQDVASIFGHDYFDTCLSKTLASFISRSRVTEIPDVQRMQFLRDCTLKLCSLDVQNSSLKAAASIPQLSQILSLGLQSKKEAVKKICSWEYVNCVDLWVMFVSTHIHDYNLQSLFFMIVKLISSLAYMFPGPRYFPLRLKCIQWLNLLSRSSGKFIPIASLVLDVLEYKFAKGGRKIQDTVNVASILKLPKHYLKSRSFEDECFRSAIEQLSLHFVQWSYHISFPDLATIPLFQLGKIQDTVAVESVRRMVKRLIDQVEQNVEFVRKKRDEVSFSPHDHQSVDSFLQFEKCNVNTPFTQYYRSVVDKAAERNSNEGRKTSSQEKQSGKRMKTEVKSKAVASDDHVLDTNSKSQKRIKGGSS